MASAIATASVAQEAPLPPATLPTMQPAPSVPAASMPSLPAAAAQPFRPSLLSEMTRPAETTPPEAPKNYSFGTSSLSILFLPTQTDRMRKAIRSYEDSAGHGATTFVAPEPTVVAAPEAEKINEPASYPVFYLASIAYDSPGSWSLWVSGHKITSRKNDTDLTVLNVSRDSATFSWSPTYFAAIRQRHSGKQFAAADPVRNRLLRAQPINLSEGNGAVTFTLHPNQSFAAGYFSLFEGFMPSPAMPVVLAPKADADSEFSPLTGASRPVSPPTTTAVATPSVLAPGAIPPSMRSGAGMPAGMGATPGGMPAGMSAMPGMGGSPSALMAPTGAMPPAVTMPPSGR